MSVPRVVSILPQLKHKSLGNSVPFALNIFLVFCLLGIAQFNRYLHGFSKGGHPEPALSTYNTYQSINPLNTKFNPICWHYWITIFSTLAD